MTCSRAIVCIDEEPECLERLRSSMRQVVAEPEVRCFPELAAGMAFVRQAMADARFEIPLIVLGYRHGDPSVSYFNDLQQQAPHTLKILMAHDADLEFAAREHAANQLYRFVAKPWHTTDIQLTVQEALRSFSREQKLELLNQAYSRFVPRQLLNLLGKNSILDIQRGQQVEREMSVFFADIRGFTALSEKMTPQQNFDFINAYLGRMEPIISAHNGFIDKYIGDAIMALFPGSPDDAVAAAIHMLDALANYNREREIAGEDAFQIGIGINTGSLMLGTVGGGQHLEGTVIADAVNLASRIEGLTKTYGVSLLISESTYQGLGDPNRYRHRIVDHVTVRGKSKAVTVYEIYAADPPKLQRLKNESLTEFVQGFEAFHQQEFLDARQWFQQVLTRNPSDQVAEIYLEHCRQVLSMTHQDTPVLLVVDDSQINLEIMANVLRHQQFEVHTAKTGQQGLQLALEKKPNLVLLDVIMPGMSGFEVCKKLKAEEETAHIPVIFITGLTEVTDKVEGFSLGAVDYITKPFQPAEVIARINTHLTLQHLHRQLRVRNVELEINNVELKQKINDRLKRSLS